MYVTTNPKWTPKLAHEMPTSAIIREIDTLSAVLDSPFCDDYVDVCDMLAWHAMLCEECYYRLKYLLGI